MLLMENTEPYTHKKTPIFCYPFLQTIDILFLVAFLYLCKHKKIGIIVYTFIT